MSLIKIDRNPPVRELRKFGLLWFPLFCGVLGGVLLHKTGLLPLSVAIWCLAAPVLLLGALKPAWVRPVWLGLMYLTFPIGFVISHVLLALIYFGVFTPIGWAMRLSGKDPLQLKRRPDRGSHWIPRAEREVDKARYFRQF